MYFYRKKSLIMIFTTYIYTFCFSQEKEEGCKGNQLFNQKNETKIKISF